MKKNVASQLIGVQMITAADGSDFTGSVTVTIAKDGAAPAASGGTGPTHQSGGYHEYNPTQAETNYGHIAFVFAGSGAITTTVQVYTGFPQTVDNNVLAAGATGFAAIDTVVDAVKAVTDNLPDSGALSDLATIEGLASGATGFAAIDTVVDAILLDTDEMQGDDVPALIAALDVVVDRVEADTQDIQTQIGTAGDGLTELATASALATVDGIADNLVSGIIFGAVEAGTLSLTQCTSGLTGYTNDQLIGRVIIFLTGDTAGEATDITDYEETNGLLTFTAVTLAPSAADTFKIV